MEVLISLLVMLGAAIIKAVCDWRHNEEIFPEGLEIPEEISHETQLREKDIEFAERSREILIRHLGEQPIDRIMEVKDAEERVQLILPIYDEVVALYGIPKPELKLISKHSNTMGGYSRSSHTLELNVAYLLVNDRAAIREFLDTIFHELRHAVQYHMVKMPGFWDADPQLRGRLAYNIRNYIRPEMDPEGYRNQLMERDAWEFAAAVMRGV